MLSLMLVDACRCRRSTNTARSRWRSRSRSCPASPRSWSIGAQKFAVRVQVDPVAAAARGISLDDVRNVVAKTNSNTPVGTISGPKQNVTLTATGAMRTAAEYRNVIVAYRNGAPVKLERDRQRRRQRREQQGRQLVQRRSVRSCWRSTTARRQHGRGRRRGAMTGCRRYRAQMPAVGQDGGARRPLDLDPRFGRATCR